MNILAGKNAVITGGETGIGLAIVEALCAAGAQVMMGGILEAPGRAAAKRIRDGGGKADFIKVDVRDSGQVDALAQAAVDRFGGIDIMVNNAGVFDGFASCLETTEALWDKVIDINLKGTFFGSQAALKRMVPRGKGRIINTASIGGLCGSADGASYTASKFAIIGLTKQIACTYGENGITANAICPGVIQTDIRANSTTILGADAPKMAGVGADPDGYKRRVPAKRKGLPSEIADLAVFLASDNSAYITGQAIAIDGGWTAM
jgi:NAD(P)-dependent dehydrogenase (short-subunit alcohol dehydrogenase family)